MHPLEHSAGISKQTQTGADTLIWHGWKPHIEQFTFAAIALTVQLKQESSLSYSTGLTLLCSFQFQSELGQKQTGFAGPCFTAQCGHM